MAATSRGVLEKTRLQALSNEETLWNPASNAIVVRDASVVFIRSIARSSLTDVIHVENETPVCFRK